MGLIRPERSRTPVHPNYNRVHGRQLPSAHLKGFGMELPEELPASRTRRVQTKEHKEQGVKRRQVPSDGFIKSHTR